VPGCFLPKMDNPRTLGTTIAIIGPELELVSHLWRLNLVSLQPPVSIKGLRCTDLHMSRCRGKTQRLRHHDKRTAPTD